MCTGWHANRAAARNASREHLVFLQSKNRPISIPVLLSCIRQTSWMQDIPSSICFTSTFFSYCSQVPSNPAYEVRFSVPSFRWKLQACLPFRKCCCLNHQSEWVACCSTCEPGESQWHAAKCWPHGRAKGQCCLHCHDLRMLLASHDLQST